MCERLFQVIEQAQEKYLNILEDVCNLESPTTYKKGVDEVGNYFLDIAKTKGWKTEIFQQETSGDVVCITLNPGASGEPISLSGHMDTVHPVGAFGTPAVRRDEENMYGPGVKDCKGGIVAAIMAMDALEKCGFRSRPVHLLLQSDEENGSSTSEKKTLEYICEKAKNSIAFLNLEGINGNRVVLERKGIIRYCFTIYGKAMHSALCTDAASAICEAAYKIIELEKMKNPDGITCNCGIIQGGTASNTVAEECSFCADIRFKTEDELNYIRNVVCEIARKTTVEGCSCELREESFRPAMVLSKKNVKLLEQMNEVYSKVGLPTLTGSVALGGSDAAYVTQAGIPCVDSLGVDGDFIHSLHEYIKMESLAESAKRIAAFISCI